MATFPTGIPIKNIDVIPVFNTIISSFDGGNEQRRKKWAFAKYDVNIDFHPMTKADMQTLWSFYVARQGPYEEFSIYDIVTMDHVDLYVGVGDGATMTFDLPGKSTSSQVVYVSGVEQSGNYSKSYNTGSDSSDQIVFTSAPDTGTIITCDFTGYLRIKCRFTDDTLTRQNLYGNVFQYSIKLKGVEFA